MKKMMRRILAFALALVLTVPAIILPAQAAANPYTCPPRSSAGPVPGGFPFDCDCARLYKNGGFTPGPVRYETELLSSELVKREYSAYTRMEKPKYIQTGGALTVSRGVSHTTKFSLSVSPFSGIKVLGAKMGVTIENSTLNLSGQVSPPAKKGLNYMAVYSRSAWRVYECVEARHAYCSHGKLLSTETRAVTVRVPYKDAKCILFGAASAYAGLPATVQSSSDKIFVY